MSEIDFPIKTTERVAGEILRNKGRWEVHQPRFEKHEIKIKTNKDNTYDLLLQCKENKTSIERLDWGRLINKLTEFLARDDHFLTYVFSDSMIE